MVCESINCPHPEFLPDRGITVPHLYDWYGYYLWKNGSDDTEKYVEKKSELDRLREEWDNW